MLSYYLLTGFLLGFLGSFHCVGMCAPIALALPLAGRSKGGRIAGMLLYHLGRSSTYALLGALVGMMGYGVSLSGWQQGLSMGLGIAILLVLMIPSRIKQQFSTSRFLSPLQKQMGKLWASPSLASMWLIGALNGLLPCGLVYAGLAGSLSTFSVWKGSLYMSAFGMGTLPLLLLTQMLGQNLPVGIRNRARRAVPVLMACMAILLIIRGLDLGIPYLSPSLPVSANGGVHCN